jgi:5-methylcytosine-specific restriction protein A
MVENPLFVPGQVYRRRDLHSRWGGQRQGGISTPGQHNLILLFTGEAGKQHGYRDELSEDGVFLYTGEGQRGDMQFISGNRAIRDHTLNGKDLHLFKQGRKGFVQYVGQMVCTGWQYSVASDTQRQERKAIVFELVPIEGFTVEGTNVSEAHELEHESLEALRQKALADSALARTPAERKAVWRRRSRAIKLYVLKRASGKCEGCDTPAPFKTMKGEPYLEPHHIRRLSDGGPDHPRWVVAVCPNCHCRVHYAVDAEEFNKRLADFAARVEGKSGPEKVH